MPLARIGVATDSIILVSQPHDKDDVKRSCGVIEELRHNGLHTYGTERCLMSARCRAVTARGCLKKSHIPPRAGAKNTAGQPHLCLKHQLQPNKSHCWLQSLRRPENQLALASRILVALFKIPTVLITGRGNLE